jgi:hypothetical protein
VANFQLAALGVKISYTQGGEFGCPDARVKQGEYDRLVPVGCRSAHGKLPPRERIGFARVGANFEHALDLVLGKGFHIHFLKTWAWKPFHWILKMKLGMCPGEEST